MLNSSLLIEGPVGQAGSFLLAGRGMFFKLPDLFGSIPEKPDKYYDLTSKINYDLSSDDRLFLSAYYSRDVTQDVYDYTKIETRWENEAANIRWTHILSDAAFFSSSVIFSDYRFYTIMNNNVSNIAIQDGIVRGEYQDKFFSSHDTKIGIEYIRHILDVLPYDYNLISTPFFQTKTYWIDEGALYVHDDWDVVKAMTLAYGIRFASYGNGNYIFVEPRISSVYQINSQISLMAQFGISHQSIIQSNRYGAAFPIELWLPAIKPNPPTATYQYSLGSDVKYLELLDSQLKDM